MTHASELGYNGTNQRDQAVGCNIWQNASLTPIYDHLLTFRQELEEYHTVLQKFNTADIPRDLRDYLTDDDKSICDLLEIHPDGLPGIFTSKSLSSLSGSSGLLEPLLTPLRHPDICFENGNNHIMNMKYLVHDFAGMCRNSLHPRSRTVFVDMGAALDFHKHTANDIHSAYSPAVYITQMYQRFGFHFDHIYAYEINKKEPDEVYQLIPDELRAAYHWYNVGVDANIESIHNPLKMLLENYNANDFVIVKLDIDVSMTDV
jgi:hypothetical protein